MNDRDVCDAVLEELGRKPTESTLGTEALTALVAMLRERRPAKIVEFGSGLSTVFLLAAARRLGLPAVRLVSFDHDKKYFGLTSAALRMAGFGEDACELIHAPLRPAVFRGKVYLVYSVGRVRRWEGWGADVMIIDGPPGLRFGREAVLFAGAQLLRPGALVILDDALRAPERVAVDTWAGAFEGGLVNLRTEPFHHGMRSFELPSLYFHGRVSPWESVRSLEGAVRSAAGPTLRRFFPKSDLAG